MLASHLGKHPRVHESAWIAPNAFVCGDVEIGPDTRVQHGAQLIAEGGRIVVGAECIVMQNAVLRSKAGHPLVLGNNCLVGPQAHLVGCTVEDEVFIATGAAVFHGAVLRRGCEVRIHAVVHIRTELPAGAEVPIGWVAVGTPAAILPPDRYDEIWRIQKDLNFPLTVYGIDRAQAGMVAITRRLAAELGSHRDDARSLE